MKAIVTGISGFAGGHLAEYLCASGDEVLGIARRTRQTSAVGQEVWRRFPFVDWDLASGTSIPRHVFAAADQFQPDCIFHLAALSLPGTCGDQSPTAECLALNVEGTRRVIELAAALAGRPRVVFVSTSRVYAPLDPAQPRIDESYPVGPVNGYGRSKLLAEAEVERGSREGGLDTVIARAFQHTGPRQDGRLMLPEWARQLAAADCPILRVRHLDAWIDCSDVRDVVRAYRMLGVSGKSGGIYNVGSGIARRTGDVVDELCRLAGRSPQIVESLPGRRQDPIANFDRLAADTGWRAAIPWEQTLRETLDDWRRRTARGTDSHSSLESSV